MIIQYDKTVFWHLIGISLPLSFPKGMDCILTRFRLIRPSLPSDYRSVSDALPCPIIADLGSKPADCPILNIITIPEFYSRPYDGFPIILRS